VSNVRDDECDVVVCVSVCVCSCLSVWGVGRGDRGDKGLARWVSQLQRVYTKKYAFT
jgi:hypothetical protein